MKRGFAAASSQSNPLAEQPIDWIEPETIEAGTVEAGTIEAGIVEAETIQSVQVTILLVGSQHSVTVAPDDPLLQDLYQALVAVDQVKQLFQVPVNGGEAVLAFTSDRLVGLITQPPLIIEQTQPPVAAATPTLETAYAAPADVHLKEGNHSHADRNPLVSDYLQLDQFLSTAEYRSLLEYVNQREGDFVPTNTFTGEANYRESVVLYSFPDYADRIANRIYGVLPQIFQHFGLQPFPISQIESQLTAHNDAQFYKIHNDNGSPDTATRELTYVYYFYRQPKPFTGGELVIYDSRIHNNYYVQADTFRLVEPRNNSIVFFLSRYMHEVLPIHCPSKAFTDSRFTVNGWIRR